MAENKCESSSAFRRPALQGQIPVASTTEKVLKQKVSRLFSFPKTAVEIMYDHMFDHLRIFPRFYELGIAVFTRKIKNSFSLFTAYQILRGDRHGHLFFIINKIYVLNELRKKKSGGISQADQRENHRFFFGL